MGYQGGGGFGSGPREMFKAICAECKKECEVPFKPRDDRPVYCRDCFSKRKAGGPFNTDTGNRPRGEGPVHTSHIGKPHYAEKKKFFGKKRPAVKRRKARG